MAKKKLVSQGVFPTADLVEDKAQEVRGDGWVNVLTGMGVRGRDRSVSNRPDVSNTLLSDAEVTALYAGDGVATRIVDSVAEDMTRNGWRIAGDDARESLYKFGESIHLTDAVTQALKWQRLYGGALIVKVYDNDYGSVEKPPRAGARVTGFKVYESPNVDLHDSVFSTNRRSPFYEDVELFSVKKRFGGERVRIHASRCEVLKGRQLPNIPGTAYTVSQKYWGQSELQAPANAIGMFAMFVQGIGHSGQEMAVSKYRLSNLAQILAEGNGKALHARMEAIELSKSLINAVLLGKDEEWGRDQLSFIGLPEVFDRLAMLTSGACGVPVTKLFGRSAAGLNSTGEGDTRDYYDMITSQQTARLGPLLTRIYGGIAGRQVTSGDNEILFTPPWSPSQEELIKMREKQATIDKIYVELGILTKEEVRRSRFDGGYSFETVIGASSKGAPIEGAV